MKKAVSIVFATAIATSGFALDLVSSVASIEWDSQQFVDFSISNVTVGAQVQLAAFVDLNGNGVLEAGEPLAVQFDLEDGFTNALGATTFVDDSDGVTNGTIVGSVSFYGNGYLHSIGSYVWKATELDGSGNPVASDSIAFSVTQPASSVLIAGEVRNYLTSNTVAGAYVELGYVSGSTGPSPSIWANENGQFSLYLPVGVDAAEAQGVLAASAGLLSAETDPSGTPISMAVFTNGLASGTNTLDRPLFVVPSVPAYNLVDITGTVYLIEPTDGGGEETNALSGTIVEIAYPDFGDGAGPEISSFNISDTNGDFSLVFSVAENANDTAMISCANPLLTMRGLVPGFETILIEGATNNVAVYCHCAEALVSGTVTNFSSGDPIVGVEVDLTSGNDLIGAAYTLSNGLYEVGLMEGTYDAQCDSDSLEQHRYVRSTLGQGYRYIENLFSGEVRGGQDLSYEPGTIVSGHVYDTGGTPIGGGEAILVQPGDFEWEQRIDNTAVGFDGHYNLLAAAGTWNVRTENDQGYWLDLYYTNVVPYGLDMPTPIVVSNAPVGGIDFYLATGARLQGTVANADGSVAGDIQMSAFQLSGSGEPQYVGGSRTGWDIGEFNFVVPSGSPVILRADSDGWQSPDTWYGDVGSRDLTTAIPTVLETTQSNLNIQLLEGFTVNGWVQEEDTLNMLPDATITAFDLASNQYGTAVNEWGTWSLLVPAGIPLVFRADAPGFEGEFMSNTYSFAQADVFQQNVGDLLDLNFTLYGSLTDSDGDGLPDYLEDSIPNGHWDPGDFSSRWFNNSDTDEADDYQEYWAGTDAWDENSIFKIIEAVPAGAGLQLRWSSVPGRDYTVQISSDLTGGSWSNVHSVVASGTETSYTPPTSGTNSYYRVEVSAP